MSDIYRYYDFDLLAEFDPRPLETPMGVQLVRETQEYLTDIANNPPAPNWKRIGMYIIDGMAKSGAIFLPGKPFKSS